MLTGPNTSLRQADLVNVVLGYNAAFRFTHSTISNLSIDGAWSQLRFCRKDFYEHRHPRSITRLH